MYSRMLAENMAALIRANKDKLAQNPKLTTALPYLLSLPAPTLWDFDVYYACEEKVDIDDNTVHDDAGLCWRMQGDFYRWASSYTALADVRVPLLAINADDDPIVHAHDLPVNVGEPLDEDQMARVVEDAQPGLRDGFGQRGGVGGGHVAVLGAVDH